jgi:hypothetical protein
VFGHGVAEGGEEGGDVVVGFEFLIAEFGVFVDLEAC